MKEQNIDSGKYMDILQAVEVMNKLLMRLDKLSPASPDLRNIPEEDESIVKLIVIFQKCASLLSLSLVKYNISITKGMANLQLGFPYNFNVIGKIIAKKYVKKIKKM